MKKGALLGLFMGVSHILQPHAVAAQEAEHTNAPIAQVGETIRDYCDRPFTLIGDADHYDLDIQKNLFGSQMVSDLSSCGVNKVFVEIDKYYQGLINAVAEGVISPEEFAEERFDYDNPWNSRNMPAEDLRDKTETVGRFIQEAHSKGIEVIAIDDPGYATLVLSAIQGSESAAFIRWTENMNDDNKQAVHQWMQGDADDATKAVAMNAMSDLQTNDMSAYEEGVGFFMKAQEFRKEFDELRLNDAHLKEKIDEHMQPHDKAAVIFGDGHFRSEHGLQSLLGEDNTRWVVVTKDSTLIDTSFYTPALIVNPLERFPSADITPRSTAPAPAMSTFHHP